MFAGPTVPGGWLLCDGASYLRATYPQLFNILGGASSPWGLPDSTHFCVPDFRGVYPKGAGTTNRAAGKDAGNNYYAATLGTYYLDKAHGHMHSLTIASCNTETENSQHKHPMSVGVASDDSGGGSTVSGDRTNWLYFPNWCDGTWTQINATHTHVIGTSWTSAVPKTDGTYSGSPRTGTSSEPACVGVKFIIATGA
jgi:microcystin-dependent protein